jgi:uncharacterized glyoxalase superfamily protein PhnB
MNKTSTLTGGSKVKAVPEGMATVTPYLICRDASNAIEFYERAFGAQTLQRLDGPDGRVMHAMIRIGDSNVMLTDSCDTMPDPLSLKGTAVSIHLQVEDARSLFDSAVEAGAQVEMPIAEQFWGDLFGVVRDPGGHRWSIATHVRDVPEDEMRQAAQENCQ